MSERIARHGSPAQSFSLGYIYIYIYIYIYADISLFIFYLFIFESLECMFYIWTIQI